VKSCIDSIGDLARGFGETIHRPSGDTVERPGTDDISRYATGRGEAVGVLVKAMVGAGVALDATEGVGVSVDAGAAHADAESDTANTAT
jgi:hypothetical protein